MIWGNGVNMVFLFPRFPGETGNWGTGEFFFPYRTANGETGKQGEYIYRRYILPVSPFPIGAKGWVGKPHTLPSFPITKRGGVL